MVNMEFSFSWLLPAMKVYAGGHLKGEAAWEGELNTFIHPFPTEILCSSCFLPSTFPSTSLENTFRSKMTNAPPCCSSCSLHPTLYSAYQRQSLVCYQMCVSQLIILSLRCSFFYFIVAWNPLLGGGDLLFLFATSAIYRSNRIAEESHVLQME